MMHMIFFRLELLRVVSSLFVLLHIELPETLILIQFYILLYHWFRKEIKQSYLVARENHLLHLLDFLQLIQNHIYIHLSLGKLLRFLNQCCLFSHKTLPKSQETQKIRHRGFYSSRRRHDLLKVLQKHGTLLCFMGLLEGFKGLRKTWTTWEGDYVLF